MDESTNTKFNPYFVPVAVLIAGAMIAGAVLYSGGGFSQFQLASVTGDTPQEVAGLQPNAGDQSSDKIKPITAQDHIRGNPDAPVKIVEFSDTECPFCKRFHPTMQQALREYDGKVAWVYRHFPLDQLHSKARREASAVELAGELGGSDKFWAYLDRLFEVTPSNDGLDLNLLAQIAQEVGLDRKPFDGLVAQNDVRGGKYADHIEADYQDAIASGGRGTPYSVVIASNGKKFPLSGAQPYEAVKQLIELALQEK